jgi:hypothetical protein
MQRKIGRTWGGKKKKKFLFYFSDTNNALFLKDFIQKRRFLYTLIIYPDSKYNIITPYFFHIENNPKQETHYVQHKKFFYYFLNSKQNKRKKINTIGTKLYEIFTKKKRQVDDHVLVLQVKEAYLFNEMTINSKKMETLENYLDQLKEVIMENHEVTLSMDKVNLVGDYFLVRMYTDKLHNRFMKIGLYKSIPIKDLVNATEMLYDITDIFLKEKNIYMLIDEKYGLMILNQGEGVIKNYFLVDVYNDKLYFQQSENPTHFLQCLMTPFQNKMDEYRKTVQNEHQGIIHQINVLTIFLKNLSLDKILQCSKTNTDILIPSNGQKITAKCDIIQPMFSQENIKNNDYNVNYNACFLNCFQQKKKNYVGTVLLKHNMEYLNKSIIQYRKYVLH